MGHVDFSAELLLGALGGVEDLVPLGVTEDENMIGSSGGAWAGMPPESLSFRAISTENAAIPLGQPLVNCVGPGCGFLVLGRKPCSVLFDSGRAGAPSHSSTFNVL